MTSFEALSPAPSHHLGVDVFVGTFGCPVVTLDVGDQSVHRDLLSLRGAIAQEPGDASRPSAGGLRRLVATGRMPHRRTPPLTTMSERHG